jgi:hypothetical protein
MESDKTSGRRAEASSFPGVDTRFFSVFRAEPDSAAARCDSGESCGVGSGMTGKRAEDTRSRSTAPIGPAEVDACWGEWVTAAMRARFTEGCTDSESASLSVDPPRGKQQRVAGVAGGLVSRTARSVRSLPRAGGSAPWETVSCGVSKVRFGSSGPGPDAMSTEDSLRCVAGAGLAWRPCCRRTSCDAGRSLGGSEFAERRSASA